MRYIGFDVGDGESAIAAFEQGSGIEPVILPVGGSRSFLSAVGMLNGEIVVGERAYTDALADGLSVRFKSRFTYDPARNEDVVRFVRGAVRDLQENGLLHPEDAFVVGCPAGWNAATRARYRELLTRAGLREPQVISESRAAFLYAKYAKTVALDIDVLSKNALVIDIGSSTLDFAYIVGGRETGVGTFGDIALGGGVLDEELLRLCVEQSRDRDAIRQVFRESRSWYSYCEIEARRLKEEYYTRLLDDPSVSVKKNLRLCYDGVQKLTLRLDGELVRQLTEKPLGALQGRSFTQAVQDALDHAVRLTADDPPQLVLLTGGASRMPFFRQLCREAFRSAAVVCCPEPEFSIAKGLSYAGWIDSNLREFRKAIEKEITEERVAYTARKAMPKLIPPVTEALVDLLIEEAAVPVVTDWQRGRISTMEEMDAQLKQRVTEVLDSPMARDALTPALRIWLDEVGVQLQALVDPICDRYEVPRKEMAMNLTAVSSGPERLPLDAKGLTGMNLIGALMTVIVSVLLGLLCGGSGIALIAAGPLGFLAGALLGTAVSLFGMDAISGAMMKANLPLLLRKRNLVKHLRSDSTRKKLRDALEKELSNPESAFQQQVVTGFSRSFKAYLNGIAQAAEIPIE
ncbi:MAG: Hsp70 family protein [Candidatus Limiplasma sp.]|nr:Hsp70 family protein [Candidatus Limiplasma sp.]